jgi:hypothetical protein
VQYSECSSLGHEIEVLSWEIVLVIQYDTARGDVPAVIHKLDDHHGRVRNRSIGATLNEASTSGMG